MLNSSSACSRPEYPLGYQQEKATPDERRVGLSLNRKKRGGKTLGQDMYSGNVFGKDGVDECPVYFGRYFKKYGRMLL
jgi:hypothetical protein